MRIPEVQDELRALSRQTGIERLHDLADELSRRPVNRRAKPSSTPMTPQLRQEIRRYADYHPDDTLAEIAVHFNVNPGRVSETLHGMRH